MVTFVIIGLGLLWMVIFMSITHKTELQILYFCIKEDGIVKGIMSKKLLMHSLPNDAKVFNNQLQCHTYKDFISSKGGKVLVEMVLNEKGGFNG